MFSLAFLKNCFKRQQKCLILILLVIVQENCSAKNTKKHSNGGSIKASESGSSLGMSRSMNSGSVVNHQDSLSGEPSDIIISTKNSKHYSPSSSSVRSKASTADSTSNNGFVPTYHDYYQQLPAASYSASTANIGALSQHLQSSPQPYKYYNPTSAESSYRARQLRYSVVPEYIEDLPVAATSFAGSSLYNSMADATPYEKDLADSGSSHGHSHGYSHGKGWKSKGWKGWKGWKGSKHTTHTSHTDYKVSAVNTDGIGLLGLLGLLSLFQFALLALTTTTTTAATTGRKKRDLTTTTNDNDEILPYSVEDDTVQVNDGQVMDNLSQIVLPSLNVFAHARNGKIPLNCTYHDICHTNQLIVKNFEFGGTLLGIKITEEVINMLHSLDKTSQLSKHLKDASLLGRMGENCEKHYPVCPELSKTGGLYSLPLLLPLTHPYYYDHLDKMRDSEHEKLFHH